MKKLLFTFPGKAGDNLFRLPVAYQYCKQNSVTTDICLDIESKFLISLFKKQRWVNDVFISEGIIDYDYGGRPYDFGKDQEFKKEYEKVFHLGYSGEFKSPNLTKVSAMQSDCGINTDNLLTEPSLEFEQKSINNLCIHIGTQTQERKNESKETILNIYDRLINIFDNIYIIDKEINRKNYDDFLNNNKTFILDDGGDLNKTVEVLSGSILIGTYGSMWALANCMKIKQVVIMNDWDICCQSKGSYSEEKWIMANDSESLFNNIIQLRD